MSSFSVFTSVSSFVVHEQDVRRTRPLRVGQTYLACLASSNDLLHAETRICNSSRAPLFTLFCDYRHSDTPSLYENLSSIGCLVAAQVGLPAGESSKLSARKYLLRCVRTYKISIIRGFVNRREFISRKQDAGKWHVRADTTRFLMKKYKEDVECFDLYNYRILTDAVVLALKC